MMVPLTEKDGEKIWINPVFVRAVKQTKKGDTEVFFHVDPARTNDRFLKVTEPAEQVAELVGSSLPLIFGGAAAAGEFGSLAAGGLMATGGLDAGDGDGGSDGDGGDGGGD